MMESDAYSNMPEPQGEEVPPVPHAENLISPEPAADRVGYEGPGQDAPAAPGPPAVAPAPDCPPHGSTDRTHVRERILRRFETWLDEVLEGEEPIQGIAAEILEQLESDPAVCESQAAEAGCDLYALWSTVTAMTEETRLQGRAFKQLHDSLTPMQEVVGSVGDVLQRYTASLEQQDQRLSESTRQAVLQEVLETLLDVRDRLVRGADTVTTWLERPLEPLSATPRPCLARRLWRKVFSRPQTQAAQLSSVEGPQEGTAPEAADAAREAVRSLLKGYLLAREVLDEALARFGVCPMDCVGEPFDPATMRAVDIDSQSDAEDGTVLEVYRQGYRWHDAVYRPAEVKVARKRNGMVEDE
ncbi:MAG: nucleotide exchange factor GrpE [Planctomycetes bacterium]|nr:nucleotide exchange factor GrpE [Planctomycetota bacterium]